MTKSVDLADVVKRLNVLILLALENYSTEGKSNTASKIRRLLALGLPPAEVAEIIGKPVNYVTATMTARGSKADGDTK